MKDILLNILNSYLLLFPDEQERQANLINYLYSHRDENITDWNNFKGHIVASGFVYAENEDKFLVLYHKDLKKFLYPGGHIDKNDKNPLEAARREIKEETGLINVEQLKVLDSELIPIDIDTHLIGYNNRLNLPEHYHFDFRYLFIVDRISDVNIDKEEHANYKWIDIEELNNDLNYGKIVKKLINLLQKNNKKL